MASETYKVTFFHKIGSAGWSESWYREADSPDDAEVHATRLARERAKLSPDGMEIQACRISLPFRNAAATLVQLRLAGTDAGVCDSPWQALNIRIVTAESNHRQFLLRGLDDEKLVNNTWASSSAWRGRFLNWAKLLINESWSLHCVDLSNVPVPFHSIAADGTLFAPLGHGVVGGEKVELLRTRNIGGALIHGPFTADVPVDSTLVKLLGWIPGQATNGGQVREYGRIFSPIARVTLEDVRKRSVGRPFGLLVGRRRRRA